MHELKLMDVQKKYKDKEAVRKFNYKMCIRDSAIKRPSQPFFPLFRFLRKVIKLRKSGTPLPRTCLLYTSTIEFGQYHTVEVQTFVEFFSRVYSVLTGHGAVSYTHLDVYKRQV